MKLSTEAIAVRVGVFLNHKASLTMRNESSVLSAQAEKGLLELISAGFVDVTHEGLAARYVLTPAGAALDVKALCGGKPFDWMKKHGSFPIAVNKVGAA